MTFQFNPLYIEFYRYPSTSLTVIFITFTWFFLKSRNWGYSEIGLSYEEIIFKREYWRFITSNVSHISLIHLLFNLSSLWSLRDVESKYCQNSLDYFRITFILLLISTIGILTLQHMLIKISFRVEYYRRVMSVGFSCAIFGWLTIKSLDDYSGYFYLLGVAPLPSILAPIVSLIIIQLIIPKSSMIGHVSGIFAGILISLQLFSWYTVTMFAVSAFWFAVFLLRSLQETSRFNLQIIEFEKVPNSLQDFATIKKYDNSSSFYSISHNPHFV